MGVNRPPVRQAYPVTAAASAKFDIGGPQSADFSQPDACVERDIADHQPVIEEHAFFQVVDGLLERGTGVAVSIQNVTFEPRMPAPPRRVLLVDDEPLLRLVVADELRENGYSVFEASNADVALSLLGASGGFDVLLTDVQMPGSVDGLRLAERVRSNWPDVKIIIFSGYQSGETGAADMVLRKPVDFSTLVDSVRQLVD
jgi:CheY-like chemotaxis protein